jgi:hypothetical protein
VSNDDKLLGKGSAPSPRSPSCGRSGSACPWTGSKHAKIVTHHEPEGHV